MSVRLSHSSKELYQQCGYKWFLHYVKKLRSPLIHSPLLVGGAMDQAFSRILMEKKDRTEVENRTCLKTEFQIFDDAFSSTDFNGEVVQTKDSPLVRYFSSDYTPETLQPEDLIEISSLSKTHGIVISSIDDISQFIEECKSVFKNNKRLELSEQIVYNTCHWYSLRRKCHFLLEKYREDLLPKIDKVFSIQEKVELKDENDLFIGYIDFVASFMDAPGKQYICDNKFASKSYAEDAVRTSAQLATYCEYKGLTNACYVVVEKGLRKKDPKYRIQVLKDKIPSIQFDKTFDDITAVFHGISAGKFEQNFESKCFFFGAACPYYDYCRSGNIGELKDCSKKK